MFLVDDDQSQVMEFNTLLDQLVRADDDVKLAIFHVFQCLSLFLSRAEARQFANFDGPVGKTIAEVLEMLFCEQRGGYQYCYLFTIHRRNKGSTQRHFRFTKTHITAD